MNTLTEIMTVRDINVSYEDVTISFTGVMVTDSEAILITEELQDLLEFESFSKVSLKEKADDIYYAVNKLLARLGGGLDELSDVTRVKVKEGVWCEDHMSDQGAIYDSYYGYGESVCEVCDYEEEVN